MSSASAAKGKRKRSGSLMEPIEEELDHLMEILPIPFEKPKPKYRKDFRGQKHFPRKPGKNVCFVFFEREGRRIVSFFKTDADFPTLFSRLICVLLSTFGVCFSPITA
ncbi:hypothetical protein CEXT_488761 [Caerostris extrusa]|uniref:Uncharacterized protein n=1 Tax=Caerostris extrusa TaxID=172846 RepID=A0AAV4Y6A4_CAEEX|nr:hypothetical protein CEXT_488761 [Caerostris extrusa]